MTEVERLRVERDAALGDAAKARVASAFAGSAYVRDRLTLPAAMLEATFGSRFRVEADRLVGLDQSGVVISDRARLGEPADFDDALAQIIAGCGYAARITRDGGGGASGAAQAGKIARAAFFAMPAAQQMAHVRAGGTVVDG